MDLFVGAREADQHSHRDMNCVSGLASISDQYVLGSLIGIKQVNITGKPCLLRLFLAQADELRKAFTQFHIVDGKQIWIYGGKK